MCDAPGDVVESDRGTTKRLLAVEKDAIANRFRALVISTDDTVVAPIVTLKGDSTNVYSVFEKHLHASVLVGNERFWKLVRETRTPKFETWRPRVGRAQLKALRGARLPETDREWLSVQLAVEATSKWLREDSSPNAFLQDIRNLVTYCKNWWGTRTQRGDDDAQGGYPFLEDALLDFASVAVGPMSSGLASASAGHGMDLAAAGHFLQSYADDPKGSPANDHVSYAQHATSTCGGQPVVDGLPQASWPEELLSPGVSCNSLQVVGAKRVGPLEKHSPSSTRHICRLCIVQPTWQQCHHIECWWPPFCHHSCNADLYQRLASVEHGDNAPAVCYSIAEMYSRRIFY